MIDIYITLPHLDVNARECDAFEFCKMVLSGVRKYKSENKMAQNSKVRTLYVDVDGITGIDMALGSAPYDLMGAVNAQFMMLRCYNQGIYEALALYSWDNDKVVLPDYNTWPIEVVCAV